MKRKRMFPVACVVVCLCAWWVVQDPPVKAETDHYAFHTKLSAEKIKGFTQHMELVYETYTKLLKMKAPSGKKFPVVLFNSEQELLRSSKGGPKGMKAYYDADNGKLMAFYDEQNKKDLYNVLAHEGIHQFFDSCYPGFMKGSAAAIPWYVEGFADCIGNSIVKDEKLVMCSLDGSITMWRVVNLAQASLDKKQIPLKTLLKMNMKQFYADAENSYAHAWSFCHFLMTAPKFEDPEKQIPDGKYRKFIDAFQEAILKKMTPDKALDHAFQVGNGGSKMPDMAELEKEWKEYVYNLIMEIKRRLKK